MLKKENDLNSAKKLLPKYKLKSKSEKFSFKKNILIYIYSNITKRRSNKTHNINEEVKFRSLRAIRLKRRLHSTSGRKCYNQVELVEYVDK